MQSNNLTNSVFIAYLFSKVVHPITDEKALIVELYLLCPFPIGFNVFLYHETLMMLNIDAHITYLLILF